MRCPTGCFRLPPKSAFYCVGGDWTGFIFIFSLLFAWGGCQKEVVCL